MNRITEILSTRSYWAALINLCCKYDNRRFHWTWSEKNCEYLAVKNKSQHLCCYCPWCRVELKTLYYNVNFKNSLFVSNFEISYCFSLINYVFQQKITICIGDYIICGQNFFSYYTLHITTVMYLWYKAWYKYPLCANVNKFCPFHW